MSVQDIRLSMGRTVQIIDYKDSVRWDVSVTFKRDIEGGEGVVPFLNHAKAEMADIYSDVEAAMLDAAGIAAREEVEVNPSMGAVNEMEPLNPKFSAPKRGAGRKGGRRKPPPKRGA